MENFTFTYSMESVNNYKLTCFFHSDKTYKIEEHNYFMDNHAGIRAPRIKEGVLTDEEYAEVVERLSACDFYALKDAYGFDKEISGMVDILYQISFTSEGKTKHVSIRSNDDNSFPPHFIDLLKYISDFLKANP
ncbi:MAG: hypothetical protein LBJ58_02995, partial [Tannerellaceae bacterium]|nr:hypothetical protein [Tannerellaceae bacterium]